ncbi:RNA polymerase sigma factor, sigma-70 family [Bacteroidales bacterium 6E]|nr:RNA polymerase sigma factor, sigma-70 family [Bacteroidales bacterium 6E]
MRLNQIMISGETRQDPGTGDTQEPALAKSIRLFFRQKLSDKLQSLIAPLLDEIDKEVNFLQSISFDVDQDASIKASKSRLDKLDLEDIGVRFRFERRRDDEELRQANREARKKEVEALLSYDREMYLDLYRYTFPQVANAIMQEGGDRQVARDVFQNALIVLLERIRSDDFELTCSAGTYLHSASVNIWRNLRRKLAQRAIQVDIRDFPNSMTETIYFEEIPGDYEKLAALLDKMEDPCKSLLENFYVRELSWEAIAEKMGYASAGSARNQKYKCIERIRKALEVG